MRTRIFACFFYLKGYPKGRMYPPFWTMSERLPGCRIKAYIKIIRFLRGINGFTQMLHQQRMNLKDQWMVKVKEIYAWTSYGE
ncbi:hypothetical protein BBD42_21090 [Paenibacillus sp. BIHB 4019]|uniref:Uncharacterized protein n=1 Tax=Paenibacillus sp. BIHB 4019 TaxID=1870819 RepID=A0A1B2DLU5_9BACL|nr:hypothetical protein BBD42_21090 [Paenibacillus sp. BIHB 4019]